MAAAAALCLRPINFVVQERPIVFSFFASTKKILKKKYSSQLAKTMHKIALKKLMLPLGLSFFVLRLPYLLARLIIKEIDLILRLNILWLGVKDGSKFY